MDSPMKTGWSRIFSFALGCVVFIGIPLVVSLGYLGWLEAQETAISNNATNERLSLILQKIETLSTPHKRFAAILRHYSKKPLSLETLKKVLLSLMKREKGALEIHLFDSKGKLLQDFGRFRLPRVISERFLKSLIDNRQPISNSIVAGYCGNPNGDQMLRDAPGTFVELFNGEKKTYGGYWTFRDKKNRVLAYSIAFVNIGLVQKDDFLDRTVREFNAKNNGATLVGWLRPFEPGILRPISQKFQEGLETVIQNVPLGQAGFQHADKIGLTHVTRKGQVLFGVCKIPPIRDQIQSYRIMIFLAGLFNILAFYRFSGIFFPPILMFSGKLLGLLGFGAGIPLLILFLTSLTYRWDRENVLIKTVEENQIRQISKVDNAYQAWLNSRFSGYEGFVKGLGGLPESEISARLKKYFSNVPRHDRNAVISVIAVSKNAKVLFSSTREKKGWKGKSVPESILKKVAISSLNKIMDDFVDPREVAQRAKSQGRTLSEVPIVLEPGPGFLIGFGSVLQSYVTTFGKEIDGLVIVIQDPIVSETRFLQEFLIGRSRTFQNDSRLVIVPKNPHPSLSVFPPISGSHRKKLLSFCDWMLSDEMPRHRVMELWEKCLVSASSGRFLKNFVLVAAYPFALIEVEARRLNFQLAIFAGGILFFSCGFGWITSRVLLIPVKKLGLGLRAFQSRLFRCRIPVDDFGAYELLRVEERFNVVMANLEELNDGRLVQQTLWPEKGLEGDGWSVLGTCVTAAELGGDMLDWFILPDGRVLIAIGDVAGHGVAASLITASAKAELFLHARAETTPAAILDKMNQGFLRYTGRVKPMSFWLAIFDPTTGIIRYTCAANPYPVLLSQQKPAELLGFPAYPIGARKAKYKESEVQLNSGDRIVLYSDGIIESISPTGELIGYDRFVEMAVETYKLPPEKAIEEILKYARDWSKRDVPEDDMTVVVFSLPANETEGGKPGNFSKKGGPSSSADELFVTSQ